MLCNRFLFSVLQLIRIPDENDVNGIRITNINIRIYYDLCKKMTKEKGLKSLILRPIMIFGVYFSGAAGSRTPVQTRNPYAFYMLSPPSVFVNGPAVDYEPGP